MKKTVFIFSQVGLRARPQEEFITIHSLFFLFLVWSSSRSIKAQSLHRPEPEKLAKMIPAAQPREENFTSFSGTTFAFHYVIKSKLLMIIIIFF